ncbi:MAG: LptF/LptG family permease [Qingshengfaniella sp.]
MGRFDSYILSQLLRVFGFFALILVGIYWVNRAVLLLDQYLSEGQSDWLLIELTLLSLPGIMLIVLPVAAFVAAAYSTNRLHADGELIVVQTTGFSIYRLARPYLAFGLIIAILLSLLAHLVVPLSVARLAEREQQLAQAVSARILVPGTFQTPTQGVTIYVRDIAADGQMQGLLVTDRRNPNAETTYSARSAVLVRDPEGPKLIMFEGMAQTLERPGDRLSVTRFSDFTVGIGDLIRQPQARRTNYRQLSTADLLFPSQDVMDRTRREAPYLKREGHERITQALIAIGAPVIGFAALMIGGFSRFGLWRQIVLAVLLIMAVKLIDNAAMDYAASGTDRIYAVYIGPAVTAIIGLGLLALANCGAILPWRRART